MDILTHTHPCYALSSIGKRQMTCFTMLDTRSSHTDASYPSKSTNDRVIISYHECSNSVITSRALCQRYTNSNSSGRKSAQGGPSDVDGPTYHSVHVVAAIVSGALPLSRLRCMILGIWCSRGIPPCLIYKLKYMWWKK